MVQETFTIVENNQGEKDKEICHNEKVILEIIPISHVIKFDVLRGNIT